MLIALGIVALVGLLGVIAVLVGSLLRAEERAEYYEQLAADLFRQYLADAPAVEVAERWVCWN